MATQLNFTTIASFDNPALAWIHRNYLAEHGIHAIVTDEHTVNIYWFYSNAIGGVKVQIPERELDRYSDLVADDTSVELDAGEDSETTRAERLCSRCGSSEVYVSFWNKRIIFLILLLLGFPIPIYSRKFTCGACGFERGWKFQPPKHLRIIGLFILVGIVVVALGVLIQLGFDWTKIIANPGSPSGVGH